MPTFCYVLLQTGSPYGTYGELFYSFRTLVVGDPLNWVVTSAPKWSGLTLATVADKSCICCPAALETQLCVSTRVHSVSRDFSHPKTTAPETQSFENLRMTLRLYEHVLFVGWKVAVFYESGSFGYWFLVELFGGFGFQVNLTNCYFLPLSATFCHMLPLFLLLFCWALSLNWFTHWLGDSGSCLLPFCSRVVVETQLCVSTKVPPC